MNDTPETRIDRNAIKAWRLSGLIYGLFFFTPAIGYGGISWWANDLNYIILITLSLAAIVLYLLVSFFIPSLRWKRWRYDVGEQEIDLLRGLVVKKRTLVPINRVQHVDTNQGPIFRKFGLSSVKISTAATTHEIPALNDEIAKEVRNKISYLVRQVKEDV